MGGKLALRPIESWVIADEPSARLTIEAEPLEVFRRHAFQAKTRIGGEPKAAIITWFSENHAPACVFSAQHVEASSNQRASDTLSLPIGQDGDGPKSEPAAALSTDPHRSEGNMTNDPFVLSSDPTR